MDEYIEQNRQLWNAWTGINAASATYDVAGFKAQPMRLRDLERLEVGVVAGKTLLHLQCHFGLDTLSWATLGAQVTGADLSSEAITLAQQLSGELDIPAQFVQSDIYALPQALEGQFDIVYTSYGVLCWLPDLTRWAAVIAHFLKPGGFFYIADFHPAMYMFDDGEAVTTVRLGYSYFHTGEVIRIETQGSYADGQADYHAVEHVWVHTLGDIVSALAGAGLRIEFLHEFPYTPDPYMRLMVRGADGWWRLPPELGEIPCLFSLKATR